MKTGRRSFWDRWAGVYDRFMRGDAALYGRIANRMRGKLRRDMHVLELACGTGLLSERIAGWVASLEATDLSPEMIAEARKKPRSARLHYSVQDATNLPYANETFDAVVIANALHIMPDPDRALREIHRVLKPGGLLFAPTFVHGEGGGPRLRARMMKLAGFQVCHDWSADGFLNYLAQFHFEIDERALLPGSVAPMCYVAARADAPNAGENQRRHGS